MGLTASAIQNHFCVDENRLFVAGYCLGASAAEELTCYFAGRDPSRRFGSDLTIRGEITVASHTPIYTACGGRYASLWIHDADDEFDTTASLAHFLAAGQCDARDSTASEAWGSAELGGVCTRYTHCASDSPVVFCETTGKGHAEQPALMLPALVEFESSLSPSP